MTSTGTLPYSVTITPSVVFGRTPVVTMVTIVNATAIRVSWTPVSDSSGYKIYITEETNNARKRQAREQLVITVSHLCMCGLLVYVCTWCALIGIFIRF